MEEGGHCLNFLVCHFLANHYIELIVVPATEALTYMISYVRFKKEVATHAIASKIWTLTEKGGKSNETACLTDYFLEEFQHRLPEFQNRYYIQLSAHVLVLICSTFPEALNKGMGRIKTIYTIIHGVAYGNRKSLTDPLLFHTSARYPIAITKIGPICGGAYPENSVSITNRNMVHIDVLFNTVMVKVMIARNGSSTVGALGVCGSVSDIADTKASNNAISDAFIPTIHGTDFIIEV
jgi:hypothetical protein